MIQILGEKKFKLTQVIDYGVLIRIAQLRKSSVLGRVFFLL